MRMLKNEAGKVIGVSMDTEPTVKRPGLEPITTRNTPVKTRAEREAARVKAEAEKKGGAK